MMRRTLMLGRIVDGSTRMMTECRTPSSLITTTRWRTPSLLDVHRVHRESCVQIGMEMRQRALVMALDALMESLDNGVTTE